MNFVHYINSSAVMPFGHPIKYSGTGKNFALIKKAVLLQGCFLPCLVSKQFINPGMAESIPVLQIYQLKNSSKC